MKLNVTCHSCGHKTGLTVSQSELGKPYSYVCDSCNNKVHIKIPSSREVTDVIEKPQVNITGANLYIAKNTYHEEQLVSIKLGKSIIGRKCSNNRPDIVIETTDLSFSRDHLSIRAFKDKSNKLRFTISDNNSTNGTLLNKKLLEVNESLYLVDGDLLTCGRTQLEFRLIT